MSSTARPYDQQTFSPPDPTAIWHSHLALAIYIFVVVNFDALAQASYIRIERRQVVFLRWRQDSNPEGLSHLLASRLNACWQTDWAIEDQAKNLNSTARPYDQQAFSPPDPTAIWHSHLALAIYIFVVVNFDALARAIDIRIERRQVVFLCWRQDSNPEGSDTYSPADWMPADKPTELSRIKLKTWTRQPVPMISKHSAHLTPLPFGIRTWLWRYTYLLLVISMLWHRQAIFQSKGDKLSSSVEGRIRTQRVSDTYSPADWMPADKPTELSRIKLKTWTRQPVPMISKHSAHLTPLPFCIRTWLWQYTYLLLLNSQNFREPSHKCFKTKHVLGAIGFLIYQKPKSITPPSLSPMHYSDIVITIAWYQQSV